MKNFTIILLSFLFLAGCSNNKEYKFIKEIKLNGMNPISAAVDETGIWVSDSKNNRIVKINERGKILEEFKSFKRPMHISLFKGKVYVPEYLNDSIKVISKGKVLPFSLGIKPNAPGGIDVSGSFVAIADFYNHRIIVKNDDSTYTFGRKGHKFGELFYPTDVKIIKDKIVVADAYNNRVQVFDYNGNALKVIGDKDKINVATGIEVTDENIFITDFEGDRILIYDFNGKLIYIINEHLNKPTEITISKNKMYVSNYAGSSISVFEQ